VYKSDWLGKTKTTLQIIGEVFKDKIDDKSVGVMVVQRYVLVAEFVCQKKKKKKVVKESKKHCTMIKWVSVKGKSRRYLMAA